jgi:hypothetical protein
VDEGISAGYGDYYNPVRQGQSIDLTGVTEGRHYLVVRSNQSRLIQESDYTNNGASMQFAISYPAGPGGEPSMRILATCRDGDHCLQPVDLRLGVPTQVSRAAHSFHVRATISAPSWVDVRLRVGTRVVSHLRKLVPAGGSSFVISFSPPITRPSSAVVAV